MQHKTNKSRRPRGTGSLSARRDRAGRETWYGRFYVDGRLVKKKIGLKRAAGTREGFTHAQASAELRRLMQDAQSAPLMAHERVLLLDVGERLIAHLETLGRKRSTVESYESYLRVHLAPFFVGRTLDAITATDIEMFMAAKRAGGASVKSILNYLGFLHSIFEFAQRHKWAKSNPCKEVDKPETADATDIRFLDQDELEALLRAVPEDHLGRTERVMYLAAAMTGMRQGECLGLRWRDVDWTAGRVRIRQNYVRGEFGTPKSKRSSRSVPLADRVAGELERHFKARYGEDARGHDLELVFAHPLTDKPIDRSKLFKRFKAAVARADVGQFEEVRRKNGKVERRPLTRFHDLRHTFGTRMAAAGVPMRTLQEWMGHRSITTTMIYADYAPSAHEAAFVERAFGSEPTTSSARDPDRAPA